MTPQTQQQMLALLQASLDALKLRAADAVLADFHQVRS